MTYKGHTKAANRAFDHLYDPLFLTADAKDVHRENMRALIRTAPVSIYPIYENMFTDLPQYQRNVCTLQQNPLPTKQTSMAAQRHRRRPITVSGSERVKYFHNPKCNSKTILVNLDEASAATTRTVIESHVERQPNIAKRGSRSIGCQTQYREQSAQTRPFLPTAAMADNNVTPEILSVFNSIDTDFVPGVYEADIIERARIRRQCEAMLRNYASGTEEWNNGRLMLEAIEWTDWLAREKDLEYCQQLRLRMVRQLLDDRHKHLRVNSASKITDCQRKYEEERDRKIEMLYKNYNRTIRQINHSMIKSKNLKKPKTITDAYLDYASDVCGPRTRHDPRVSNFITHNSEYNARLETLHKSDPTWKKLSRHAKLKPKLHEPKQAIKEFSRGFWDAKNLQKIYHALKALRLKSNVHREIAHCLRRIKHSSPSKDEIVSCDAQSEQLVEAQQFLLTALLEKECEAHTLLEQPVSSSAASMLEHLERQINKLTEQKTAHALYMLAEKQHSQCRMAASSDSSLDELRHREQEDMYQRIMQAHNDTSTFYLENVLMQCFKNITESEARDRIRSMARKIDENVLMPVINEDIVDTRSNRSTSTDEVSNVMENYCLPNFFQRLDGHIKRKQLTLNLNNATADAVSNDASDLQEFRSYNMPSDVFTSPRAMFDASQIVSPVSADMLHDILEEAIAEHDDGYKRDILMDIVSDLYERIENMMDDHGRVSDDSGDGNE